MTDIDETEKKPDLTKFGIDDEMYILKYCLLPKILIRKKYDFSKMEMNSFKINNI